MLKQCDTVLDMRTWCHEQRVAHKRIALVPTMGNLHAGHISLIKEAQKHADAVVVSIFVNPLQFGPKEDFGCYPRTLEADKKTCLEAGVTAIFTPNMAEIHPTLSSYVQVSVPGLSDELCGKSRPGFFYGIATVVAKLFNIILPDVAVFGEKDYQQYKIIEKMVQELHYPIGLVMAPIVRELDGLAMSSRNQYLSPENRKRAATLYQHLQALKHELETTKTDPKTACSNTFSALESLGFTMDYLEPRSLLDCSPIDSNAHRFKVLLACWLDKTRLIDNISVFR